VLLNRVVDRGGDLPDVMCRALVGAFDQRCEHLPERHVVVRAAELSFQLELSKSQSALGTGDIIAGAEPGLLLDELLQDLRCSVVLLFEDHAFRLGAGLTEMALPFLGRRIGDVHGGFGFVTALAKKTHQEVVRQRVVVIRSISALIVRVLLFIVNQAGRFGLAQLYQLRGRVGRGINQAYAYLFFDRRKRLTPQAHKRLQTIFEATQLGSGFAIAMRDLEIRGAGNLLGVKQSGHIAALGFDLYCQLLAEAVE